VNLLLDTHVLLWMLCEPLRLNQHTQAILASTRNMVFVSSISALEIEIKRGLGKIRMDSLLSHEMDRRELTHLPFTVLHVEAVRALPALHADPFDRCLVAQARCEKLTLVTHDRMIWQYEVDVVKA